MPPAAVPMYGPPLVGSMSAAPQAFSSAPMAPMQYGQSAVPQYSAAPQYPGGFPGDPYL